MNCECGCNTDAGTYTKTDSRYGHVKGRPRRFINGHNVRPPMASGEATGLILDASPREIGELEIRQLRSMPDEEAAQVLDLRLRELEKQHRRGFVERGLILVEVEERQLWDKIPGRPFKSMNEWIANAATHSRSDCYAARDAVKKLRSIPTEQLKEIPRCNVNVMLRDIKSEAIRNSPEVVEAAQTLSENDFREKLTADYPDQLIENKVKVVLHFDKSAYDFITSKLAEGEFSSWEQGVEAFAASFEVCIESEGA